jgi:hypothetical protein
VVAAAKPRLWKCPKCGKRFVTPKMWHSCGRHTVRQFFEGKSAKVKALYRAYVKFARQLGPFIIDPAKTRISFQGRVRFAGVSGTTKDSLIIGFWLKRRVESPRFMKVDVYPRNDHVYKLRLSDVKELDAELLGWLREAYDVGQQKGIRARGVKPPDRAIVT